MCMRVPTCVCFCLFACACVCVCLRVCVCVCADACVRPRVFPRVQISDALVKRVTSSQDQWVKGALEPKAGAHVTIFTDI